jgi:FtsH-binding integral membrane protein
MNQVAPLVYVMVFIWSLARSSKPLKTLLWMTISWVAAICLIVICGVVEQKLTGNPYMGAAIAAQWTIPSFVIPAVVGFLYSRKHRRLPVK